MEQRMHGLKLRKMQVDKRKAAQMLNMNLSLFPVFVETSTKKEVELV